MGLLRYVNTARGLAGDGMLASEHSWQSVARSSRTMSGLSKRPRSGNLSIDEGKLKALIRAKKGWYKDGTIDQRVALELIELLSKRRFGGAREARVFLLNYLKKEKVTASHSLLLGVGVHKKVTGVGIAKINFIFEYLLSKGVIVQK